MKSVVNPRDFPIEICMLFERASLEPVRMPGSDEGFDTKVKAFGAKMALARWRAQMQRYSDKHPSENKSWSSVIQAIQFSDVLEDDKGFYFNVTPHATGTKTLDMVRKVVGAPVALDEFWASYEGATKE